MRVYLPKLLGILLLPGIAAAQPHINYRGVVNAASYVPVDLPSGAIAQGSIFSIFGSGIGPSTLTITPSFPVPPTLAGVSINVTQGNTTVAALPLVVSSGQINAVMPSNAPIGRVSVQVTYNGKASNYSPAVVAASSFGIFAANSGGFGPGILQNYVSPTALPVNSLTAAAKPGQVLVLWGTGLGPIANDAQPPTAGNLPTPVEVFVGVRSAPISYSGRSPCCAGVDQIAITLPGDTPLGCWVPVQVRTNKAVVSNTVTIAVSSDRSACTEPANPLAAAYLSGGNVGVATAIRHVVNDDLDFGVTTSTTIDSSLVSTGKENGGPFAFNRAVSLPPLNTCTTYVMAGGLLDSSSLGFFGAVLPSGASLDAGPNITLQTATGSTQIPRYPLFPYMEALGPTFDAGQNLSYTAPGGADVGSFQVTFPTAAPLTLTSPIPDVVDRSTNLTVSWAARAGSAYVVGTNYDVPNNSSTTFVCAADAAAGTFTVPSYILSTLPMSRRIAFRSAGYVMLGYSPAPVSFTAANLNAGFARFLVFSDTKVLFQ